VAPCVEPAAWLVTAPVGPVVTAVQELRGDRWVLVTMRDVLYQVARTTLQQRMMRTDVVVLATDLQLTCTH